MYKYGTVQELRLTADICIVGGAALTGHSSRLASAQRLLLQLEDLFQCCKELFTPEVVK
jgi:hypothetical protein